MIGRLYTWRGAVWLLLVRGEPFDRGPRRNVLLEQVIPWMGVGMGDHWVQSIDGHWYRPLGDGERRTAFWPFNVRRVVRPFRGLRRWRR